MPPLDLGQLQAGAAALGHPLSDAQAAAMDRYIALLARWNRVYNLTAVRDVEQMGVLHLLDSLAAVPPLVRHAAGKPLRVLDAGSGGGLPGVVLALAQPSWTVTCVDAVAKKAGFVQQVALEVPVPNLRAVHGRIEAVAPGSGHDVVVSRAFASLADFAALTRSHLAPTGVWFAMKGKPPQDEIAALPADVQVFHVEQLDVPGLGAARCAVWMRPNT